MGDSYYDLEEEARDWEIPTTTNVDIFFRVTSVSISKTYINCITIWVDCNWDFSEDYYFPSTVKKAILRKFDSRIKTFGFKNYRIMCGPNKIVSSWDFLSFDRELGRLRHTWY